MFMQQKLGLRRFFTMKTTPEETKKNENKNHNPVYQLM